MKTIKLTQTQLTNLHQSMQYEATTRQQLEQAQANYKNAQANNRMALNLILDSHGMDVNNLPDGHSFNLKDGSLIYNDGTTASDRIKKAVKMKPLKK